MDKKFREGYLIGCLVMFSLMIMGDFPIPGSILLVVCVIFSFIRGRS